MSFEDLVSGNLQRNVVQKQSEFLERTKIVLAFGKIV
jgi:hypothetical protein